MPRFQTPSGPSNRVRDGSQSSASFFNKPLEMSDRPHTRRVPQFTRPLLFFFQLQTLATYLRCSCCSNPHNTGLFSLLSLLLFLPTDFIFSENTENEGLRFQSAELLQTHFPQLSPGRTAAQSGWSSKRVRESEEYPLI